MSPSANARVDSLLPLIFGVNLIICNMKQALICTLEYEAGTSLRSFQLARGKRKVVFQEPAWTNEAQRGLFYMMMMCSRFNGL